MNAIKRYRNKFGLSQCELADLCGVVPSTISMWESGERVPNSYSLKKLCEIFSCSADEVLGLRESVDTIEREPERFAKDMLVFSPPDNSNVPVRVSWKANEMIEEIARISGQSKSDVASKMIEFAYDHTEIRAEEE